MAPYPSQQQQPLPHSIKPAATPTHRHGRRGNPQSHNAVPASLRRAAPTDARGLRALIKSLCASSAAAGSSAAAVHGHAAKLGLDRERTVRNSLIALYLASGDRAAAGALFHVFPDGGRDVVSWTAMVTGHTRLGLADEAVDLFFAMMEEEDDDDLGVDAVAAAAGFAACAELKDLAVAMDAHGRVAAMGIALDTVAWNAMVDMYAKCGDVAAARRWFARMPATAGKTTVSWNTMISALSRAGEHGEALALFREMQLAGDVRPDDATLVAVLGACAHLGALDAGRWVHAYVARHHGRLAADGVIGNALIDMYAKCGEVDHAIEVFDAMATRDVYTYASMIMGLATHGRADDALGMFDEMRRAGVRPNGVALLGVLAACCHAGRVDDGIRHLRDMARCHGVAPGIEHYGCAVDMLGRAGRLNEAEELVAAMPMAPDALVRGSLLAACRARGDVERAERVMRWMDVCDDGGDSGDHVLMSNMYAARAWHGRVVRLRKKMKEKNLVKEPGCSVIEIDGVVHEFRAVPANSIK
ncbi:hypothetical protein HU200_004165 [Digitaria exilis]|uniref:Pentatricopeptide repeat-containing protein n=1 Tax=Digitaria exilis TaxID=1010633 RepID=A0A835FVD8_9POAL|nr:hypothetical protein HU200_004165 [Digitaria exilis]